MGELERFNVGDKVVITPECIEIMRRNSRSCVFPGYPSDSYINNAERCVGIVGEVTHTFLPGYEFTARFDDASFHMRYEWVKKLNFGKFVLDINLVTTDIGEEVATVLKKVAEQIREGYTFWPQLYDSKGNRVGVAQLVTKECV